MQITLLAQGAAKEIKGNCGHWVSVRSFKVTRSLLFGGELEICRLLLQLVFIQKVFKKGTLRRGSIHRLTYLASVCPSSLLSRRLPFRRCRKRRFQPGARTQLPGSGERAGTAPRRRRCHVGRGTRSPHRCREGAVLRNSCFSIGILLIPPTPNPIWTRPLSNESRLDPKSSVSWICGKKPLGKGSVCGLILRSSPAAARQSLLSGNSSGVGYQVALGRLSPSSAASLLPRVRQR